MKRSYSSELAAIEAHPGEPLIEHLWAVADLAESTAAALPGAGPIAREPLRRAARILGASHDLAKATPYFQAHLRGQKPSRLSSHAFSSAMIGYLWAREELPGAEPDPLLGEFLPVAVFLTIRRHHGFLRQAYEEASPDVSDRELVEEQWRALRGAPFDELLSLVGAPFTTTQLGSLLDRFWTERETRKWRRLLERVERAKDIRFYLSENMLFSLLIDADRRQTALPVADTQGSANRSSIPSDMVDSYQQKKRWNDHPDSVNTLRQRLHHEVDATVGGLDLDHHFFSLTAPTGLGKTLSALSWVLKLREQIARERGYLPRLVYCLPFLSIIDQNAAVLREVLAEPASNVLVVHHHLGDSRYTTTENEYDSDISRLLIEGWQSEIVVTTFVQLFATMINNRSRPLLRLSRLAGAIVILDEVQTLPARYWSLFEALARGLATSLGTTFVLMTATQPALFAAEGAQELVPRPESYFSQMRRVTLLNETTEPMGLPELVGQVSKIIQLRPRKSIGVVVNTTRAAYELRAMLATDYSSSHEIVFLSSLVAPIDRLAHIDQAKRAVDEGRGRANQGKPLLLVSTQVIEAGVDLDLDEFFRDFAPLDSVVQAAGRCNRNGSLPDGAVHLVRLVNENGRGFAEQVYDRVLLDATREVLTGHERIAEAALPPLVERYFRLLRDRVSMGKSADVLEAAHSLNYYSEGSGNARDVAVADFTLIEDDQPSADVFLELDDPAGVAWEDLRSAREIRDRRDRSRRYAEIRPRLAPYVISVSKRLLSANLPFIDGETYYVPRGQLADYYDRSTGWKLDPPTHRIW